MPQSPPIYDLSSLPDQPEAPAYDLSLLPDKPEPASLVTPGSARLLDRGGPTASSDPSAYPQKQWGDERFADSIPGIANNVFPNIPAFNAIDALRRLMTTRNSFTGVPAGLGRGAEGDATASQSGTAYAIERVRSFLMKLGYAACDQGTKTEQVGDMTNQMLDDVANLPPAAGNSEPGAVGPSPDENGDTETAPAAQNEKYADSWFWQTLESSDTLKPYAQKIRQYVESSTDTKGVWDWLTDTIPKSAAQWGVKMAKTPFDLAQIFSSESRAGVEKFLQEHPGYEQIVQEDPTGESLQALGSIGMSAGVLKTAEAVVEGTAATVGKPVGIDAEKQTWSWENFKDAWVNHPVESFAAVFPLGAAFFKWKGITPTETQVRDLVDSAVNNEKTPLARELKNEMEQGPPKEKLDFSEDSEDASLGRKSTSVPEGAGAYEDVGVTIFMQNPASEGIRHTTRRRGSVSVRNLWRVRVGIIKI